MEPRNVYHLNIKIDLTQSLTQMRLINLKELWLKSKEKRAHSPSAICALCVCMYVYTPI